MTRFPSLLLCALAACTTVAAAPQRVVTLSAPVTETVYALGAGNRVVGTDISSVYPEAARKLPQVGYYRTVSPEGVLSLRPDLVVGTEEAGPPEALRQLRDAGVRVVLVPASPSPQGARDKLAAIAAALGTPDGTASLLDRFDRDLDSARAWVRANGKSRPRVLFLLARGQGMLSVAGRATAADAMIALAGGTNAVDGYEGYKPMTPEALAVARPDVILTTTTGVESIGGVGHILRQPGISLTPAGRAQRILVIEDNLLLSFGPRLAQGILALAQGIHASPEPAGKAR